ncbi:Myb-DNA-bind-6 multi-domain protein [Pyrenophora tritici-repentis]|nr:Myb-DNA-bind-6 multi-domain protein [Pyrenophora tritici-repentis]KAI1689924.1 Myb-DNA-bind-6 multi-domain protein [Pyrenophora tritici-repentis]
MADPNGPPRRVSMSYLLGFSDKPFKGPKQPSVPRPRRPSQLAEMVTTPGGIIEWAASDGRKGRLTGTGKSRLTAAALAKVPSEKRSTHEALAAKSASKHGAPDKPANDAKNSWDNTEAKNGTKHSGSKKAASNKEDAWGTTDWGIVNSKNDTSGNPHQWASGALGNPWDMPIAVDGKDNKKDDTTGGPQATGAPVEITLQEATVVPVVAEKKADESQSWTKEQDEKLIQLKTQNAVMKWTKIAEEVGKPHGECARRFKEIKPVDWKPDIAKKGGAAGGGDGGGGKKGKKGKKGNDNRAVENEIEAPADIGVGDDSFGMLGLGIDDDVNKGNSDKKEDSWGKQASVHASGVASGWEKPGETTGWDDTGDNNAGWGGPTAATGGADTSGEIAWDSGNTWGGNDQAGAGADNAVTSNTWNNPGGDGVADQWSAPTKPASAPRSNKAPSKAPKAPSQSRSQGKDEVKPPEPAEPAPARPVTIELRPDDTFSADDLRQIARILQQDCAMVWNRVSWRFKDKTGRTLHPDVFEKKITGQVEGKGSEKGGRKK